MAAQVEGSEHALERDAGAPAASLLLGRLIERIGGAGFEDALLDFLGTAYDVEHFLIYRMASHHPTQILMASRGAQDYLQWASRHFLDRYVEVDPLRSAIRTAAASDSPRLFRTEVDAMPHRALFLKPSGEDRPKERVIVSGRAAGTMLAISLIRPAHRGMLKAEAASHMLQTFPLLLPMIGRHEQLRLRSGAGDSVFSSVEQIEQGLARADAGLSRRETQVCARMIYGMSAQGIAIDLDVGTESVVTYRKRAYRRLGIASQFELVRWYMSEASRPN
ncbi:MAG TPA: helix-turn-helix transcriptional regulator [Sphingobium sp.]|nr:helix-turn-helix transcriptional regulator [Sphingobium sp.]